MHIDGYDDFQLLGGGGFSTVYKAEDIRHDRTVAIKVLTVDEIDPATTRRFERECRAMGRISSHPNIVSVLDSGISAAVPFIVMELYEGGTLAQKFAEAPLDKAELFSAGVEIASALASAHANEIVHRDIKPANILISVYKSYALADFGISAFTDANTVRTTNVAFTPLYAAPEVIEQPDGSMPEGQLSDIYSLGATLYAALTGAPPFAADSLTALLSKIVRESPPPIERADVGPELEAFLRRMLSKDPAERPQSALEVARGLQRIEEGEGLSPTPLRVSNSGGGEADIDPNPGEAAPAAPVRPTRDPAPGPGKDGHSAASSRNVDGRMLPKLDSNQPAGGRAPSGASALDGNQPEPTAIASGSDDQGWTSLKDLSTEPTAAMPPKAMSNSPATEAMPSSASPTAKPWLAETDLETTIVRPSAEATDKPASKRIWAVLALAAVGILIAGGGYFLSSGVSGDQPEETDFDDASTPSETSIITTPEAPTRLEFLTTDEGDVSLVWQHAGGSDITFQVRDSSGNSLAAGLTEPSFALENPPQFGDCFLVAATRVSDSGRQPVSKFEELCR